MTIRAKGAGFSLIEVLAVVAIMGIIAAVAIPSYLGQRTRAKNIGDAQSNAQIFRMALETYKADNGVYGVDGTAYVWTGSAGTTVGSANANLAALLPAFNPGGTRMNLTMQTNGGGTTYKIQVADPSLPTTPIIYMTNQAGASLPTNTAFP